jgi:DNA-binding transcriptional regulator YdaS (Cro superfamily)
MGETPLEKAVRITGGQSQLARRIGGKVRQGYVWKWLRRGYAPAEHALAIERATQGAVTRYELRPDVFGPSPRRGRT